MTAEVEGDAGPCALGAGVPPPGTGGRETSASNVDLEAVNLFRGPSVRSFFTVRKPPS
jgi:hypothetical protein